MTRDRDKDTARRAQVRLASFLDEVARLMARRWLREQRQADERSSGQGEHESGEDRQAKG